ncbi:MAG TPA: hypothetical protein VEO00_01075 [Actinomycetota bacterium]|nr:hypothetical protein [Actinomycetota bacterium]
MDEATAAEEAVPPLPAPVKAAVWAAMLFPAAAALTVALWKLRRRLREQLDRSEKKRRAASA